MLVTGRLYHWIWYQIDVYEITYLSDRKRLGYTTVVEEWWR